ncbi:MAG TPA: hypothetical protein VIC06_14550 [Solirubrobacteraceae bacterium]
MSAKSVICDDVPSWWLESMSMTSAKVRALEDKATPREPGWREGPNLDRQSDYHWALEHFFGERMDPGIVHIVRLFKEHDIETCQSCQGGEGHSYTWPTVDIYGDPWKALSVCNNHALPVHTVSHQWDIENGEPTGQFWRIEFSPAKLAPLQRQWCAQEARDRAEYLAWLKAHPEAGSPARSPTASRSAHAASRSLGQSFTAALEEAGGHDCRGFQGDDKVSVEVSSRERVVREDPLVRHLRSTGMRSYLVPPQVCASCSQSPRGSFHAECRRDEKGRLLVVEETLQR